MLYIIIKQLKLSFPIWSLVMTNSHISLYQPKLITVLGGTGFVGKHLVALLSKQNYRIRVISRYPEKCPPLTTLGAPGQIQICKCNIRDKAALEPLLKDSNVVINLVGVSLNRKQQSFKAINIDAATEIAKITAKAGIQLIHMSVLTASETAQSAFSRSKAAADKRIRQIDPKAIILKPSLIFGAQGDFLTKLATITKASPIMPLIEQGATKLQPVHIQDVTNMIAFLLTRPPCDKKTFELGGADIISLKQLFESLFSILDIKKPLISMPISWIYYLATFCEIISRLPFFTTQVIADHVLFLKADNVVSANAKNAGRSLEFAGIQPKSFLSADYDYLNYIHKSGAYYKQLHALKKYLYIKEKI